MNRRPETLAFATRSKRVATENTFDLSHSLCLWIQNLWDLLVGDVRMWARGGTVHMASPDGSPIRCGGAE
jgi:hypothetical protein